MASVRTVAGEGELAKVLGLITSLRQLPHELSAIGNGCLQHVFQVMALAGALARSLEPTFSRLL